MHCRALAPGSSVCLPTGSSDTTIPSAGEGAKSKGILIVPHWPHRPWFPELLQLVERDPWMIPVRADLLREGPTHHPQPPMFKLIAWRLNGAC